MAVPRLLAELSQEVRDLAAPSGTVPRVRGPLSPVEFLREYVAQNRPCIIEGAIDAWPALALWSDSYLAHAMGARECHVDLTPDGRGDALVRSVASQDRQPALAPALAPLPCFRTRPPVPSGRGLVQGTQGTQGHGGTCSWAENPGASGETACRGEQAGASPGRGASDEGDVPSPRAQEASGASGSDGGPGTVFFTTPFSTRMHFSDFLSLFRDSVADPTLGVPYIQHQNSSLTEDFSILASDVAGGVPFATAALGSPPEATNFWLGDGRAETSWHKDHYENLYAVVAGEKHFRLMPPCDAPCMAIRPYPAASYWRAQAREGPFLIIPDTPRRTVPWASVDASLAPLFGTGTGRNWLPGEEGVPLSDTSPCSSALAPRGPTPISCTLRKGDLLYLPAMWFHYVQQTPDEAGRTIAVNFWYDMAFDAKYAYYNLVQGLANLQG